VVASPAGFAGFPTSTTDERLWAEALIWLDAEDVLGSDPIEAGLLPVALRLGVVLAPGAPDAALAVDPDSFTPTLYLQDGTALRPATEERLAEAGLAGAAARQGLSPGRLAPWDEAREGLVFFDLGDVRVQRHYALVQHGELYREVDLYRGLLGFRVESNAGTLQVRVGIRSRSFAGRES
jgi:hypothetical protein